MYVVKYRDRTEYEYECPEDAAAEIAETVEEATDFTVKLQLLGPIADAVVEDEDNPDRGAMLMLLSMDNIITDVLEAKAMQLDGDGCLIDAGYYQVHWRD